MKYRPEGCLLKLYRLKWYNSQYILFEMRLTITQRKREEDQREMIELSCKTSLSRINPNTPNIMYLIDSLCSAYSLQYSDQFGFLCAHISLHYPQLNHRRQRQDWIVADCLINKFRLIFLNSKFQHKVEAHPYFECFDDLGSYGMKAMAFALDQDMVNVLNTKEKYKERLRNISNRLIKSMVLEYVPKQYSAGVIKIYLEDRKKQQNEEIYCNMYHELYPYHDLFLIMHSLSRYLIETKKLVNLDHYLEMMEKPMMGVVEWPMIIGSRDMNELPPIFQEK